MKLVEEGAVGRTDDEVDKAVLSKEKHQRKPLSKPRVTFADHVIVSGRPSRWQRRLERNREVSVANDLYWFLRLEFLFVARTADTLRQMKAKARQFLMQHDMNGLTMQEQYCLVVETIRATMEISTEEENLRQGLKNPDSAELRAKHAALVTKGVVGNSWFGLGAKHTLPAKSI